MGGGRFCWGWCGWRTLLLEVVLLETLLRGRRRRRRQKIKRVSESGGQQKRTLRASWDIQLGAKLRSAAKCGAYYQAW